MNPTEPDAPSSESYREPSVPESVAAEQRLNARLDAMRQRTDGARRRAEARRAWLRMVGRGLAGALALWTVIGALGAWLGPTGWRTGLAVSGGLAFVALLGIGLALIGSRNPPRDASQYPGISRSTPVR